MDIKNKILYANEIHVMSFKGLDKLFKPHIGKEIEAIFIAKTNITQSDVDLVLFLYSDGTWFTK